MNNKQKCRNRFSKINTIIAALMIVAITVLGSGCENTTASASNTVNSVNSTVNDSSNTLNNATNNINSANTANNVANNTSSAGTSSNTLNNTSIANEAASSQSTSNNQKSIPTTPPKDTSNGIETQNNVPKNDVKKTQTPASVPSKNSATQATQSQVSGNSANTNSNSTQNQNAATVSNINKGQTNNDNQEQIVYITKTGKKYHVDGCRYLSRSQISIQLKDAKAEGYTPCSVCNPPR